MNDLPGYARAQREWEDRTPPDDGPNECPDCFGSGQFDLAQGEGVFVPCRACKGFGLLLDGEPFDPHAAEIAADIAADHRREDYRHE